MYMVLDLETTGVSSKKRVANPLDHNNKIVAIIKKYQGQVAEVQYEPSDEGISRYVDLKLDGVDLIIGMNLKFDLLYLWKNPSFVSFLERGGKIWDIQLAEFLIQGQNPKFKFVSLDKLSVLYGGKIKPSEQHELLALPNGLGFRNVPVEMRDEYCLGDADNPELIYLKQLEIINSLHPNFLRLIEIRMDYLLATCEAEYNGIAVDIPKVRQLIKEYTPRIETLKILIWAEIEHSWPENLEFNLNSNEHISACIHGHYFLKEHVKDEHGQFVKTGKLLKNKERKLEKSLFVDPFNSRERFIEDLILNRKYLANPFGSGPALWVPFDRETAGWKYEEDLKKFTVDKNILKSIKDGPVANFCAYLLEYRKLTKQLNTYLLPILENLYGDGTIKGQYNHVSTVTGRLSSSDPNMQNIDKNLRDIFIPRSKFGFYLVLDLSQIEVVGAAYQSQDPVMLDELRNGYDMHKANAEMVFGVTEDKQLADKNRTTAKITTFQLLYGASKKKVGEDFFNFFHNKYKQISVWHDSLLKDLYKYERYNPDTDLIESYLVRDTGRRYYFVKYEASDYEKRKGILNKYSTTQLKDWPVQGDAADMLADIGGVAFRYLLPYRDTVKICGFIHDEIDIDFKDEQTKDLHLKNLYDIVCNTGERWKEYFNIELNVPIRSSIEISNESWGKCKEIKLGDN